MQSPQKAYTADLVAAEGGEPGADTEEGGDTHQDDQGRVVDVEVAGEPWDELCVARCLGGSEEGRKEALRNSLVLWKLPVLVKGDFRL